MVNDSKITVKFFLQERVKPFEHKGNEYFPVYAMVIFRTKNTQFILHDFDGRQILATKDLFSAFNLDYEKLGVQARQWWYNPWLTLLSKALILEKTVSICSKNLGSNFSLKSVSQAFRAFEQNTSLKAYEWACSHWTEFTRNSLEVNDFLKYEWDDIHFSAAKMDIWKGLTSSAKRMNDDQKIAIEAFVAIASFDSFLRQKRTETKETRGIEPPSTEGSILSWVIGNEKHEFRNHIERGPDIEAFANSWGMNWSFIHVFMPKRELIDRYIYEIDGIVQRNFSKNLENIVSLTNSC